MRNFILITLSLCYAANSFSQDFYISQNNDTVKGLVVNYKEWTKNPQSISFSISSSGNQIELTPFNCKGFATHTDVYVSYHGTRITNSANTSDITSGYNSQMIKDSVHVFLRELYNFADYAVYKLFDNIRTNLYLGKNNAISELEYYEYVDDSKKIIRFNGYKNYLTADLAEKNIEDLKEKIARLDYSQEDIIDFFAKILNDSQYKAKRKKSKYPAELFLGGGMTMNFGTMDHHNATSVDRSYQHTTSTPSFEAGIILHSQRNFGKLFIKPSVGFSTLSHTFHTENNMTLRVRANLINCYISGGYLFVKGNLVSAYASIGAGINIVSNHKTQFNYSTTVEIKENADKTLTSVIIRPEAGVILARHFNIGITGSFAQDLPYYAFPNYTYSFSQVSILIRYILALKKKNN